MKSADLNRLLLVVIVLNYANLKVISGNDVASSAATSLSSPQGTFTAAASTSALTTSPFTQPETTTTISSTANTTPVPTTTPLTTPTTTPSTTTPTIPPTILNTTEAPTTTTTILTTTTTTTTTPSPTPSPTSPPTTTIVATTTTQAQTTSTAKPTTIEENEAYPPSNDVGEKIYEEKVMQLERENERLKIAVGVLAAIIIVTVLFVLLIIYLRKRNSVELRTSEKPNRPIYFRPVSNFKKTPPIDPALEYLHDDRLFVNDLDKEMETFRLNRGTNQMTSEL
ncbi:hypothetical protein LOTGIDRAFT_237663 [Lottia gigantea]|uniref:Uncharacterized protein n=1 Tax=Lottia gigantea TaxID=225164 RepID=V4AHM3_LOTGI|nr:hypothetical protein LOTGIDRAFT_237663 [Lottia gigantea]ESP03564.1 hypothetical protein LOTGIDRAFT_237663 [Lottia gigantea]